MAKLGVSVATGSIGVLSEAIHSGLDLLSSLVTFFVVRASVRPADWDHPFGHGKIEGLSALFEAFLLLVAGGYIVYEGASRWAGEGRAVQHLDLGILVTGVSAVVNLLVYLQNRRVADAEESLAIETNSFHFLTDVFSSLAVFLSLGLMRFTDWVFLDPLVALVIAGYIFWVGVEQIKKCLAELSDTTLPEEEVAVVRQVLNARDAEYLNYHDLRTRKAGAVRYIELHLTVCEDVRVREAHDVCDRIEDDLSKSFKKEMQVNIHVEPCGNHGPACAEQCLFYNQPRKSVTRHA